MSNICCQIFSRNGEAGVNIRMYIGYVLWENGYSSGHIISHKPSTQASLGNKVVFLLHLTSCRWFFEKSWTSDAMPTAYWYSWNDGKLASSMTSVLWPAIFTWANHFKSLLESTTQRTLQPQDLTTNIFQVATPTRIVISSTRHNIEKLILLPTLKMTSTQDMRSDVF